MRTYLGKKSKNDFAKYPRSPWWIHNERLADFCGIKHDADVHNTTILVKYMPRGQTFWVRDAVLNSKMLKIIIVVCLNWNRVFCIRQRCCCRWCWSWEWWEKLWRTANWFLIILAMYLRFGLIVRRWWMGVGNSKFFLCFPKSHKKMNPPDNTTANTQILLTTNLKMKSHLQTHDNLCFPLF